jgi:hypothetical protein
MLINLVLLGIAVGVAIGFTRRAPTKAGRALRLAEAALPAALAWASLPRSDGGGLRPVAVALLLTVWSLGRLLLVTTEPEGARPAPKDGEIGAKALRVSLLTLPAQDLILNGVPFPLGVLDLAGAILVSGAAVAEHRLVRLARHARPIDAALGWRPMTGAWSWSQEPARAASLLLCLGLWLLAAAGGVPMLGIFGLVGAGVGQWLWIRRRPAPADPEAAAWVERTSALLPMPPGFAWPTRAAEPEEAPRSSADAGFWTPAPGEVLPPVIDRKERAERAEAEAASRLAAEQRPSAAAPQPRASPSEAPKAPSQGAPFDPYRRS